LSARTLNYYQFGPSAGKIYKHKWISFIKTPNKNRKKTIDENIYKINTSPLPNTKLWEWEYSGGRPKITCRLLC
jgi:hypothetical protein